MSSSNLGGRPRSFTSVQQLQDSIDTYFAVCAENSEPPLMSELADSLDVHPDTLCEYANGAYDEDNDDGSAKVSYSEAIKRAKVKVEIRKNKNLIMGKGSTIGLIFDLKFNHGWTDKTEVQSIQTVTTIVKKDMDSEQAQDAYNKQMG